MHVRYKGLYNVNIISYTMEVVIFERTSGFTYKKTQKEKKYN